MKSETTLCTAFAFPQVAEGRLILFKLTSLDKIANKAIPEDLSTRSFSRFS
jgi:hypothetical protein